MFPDADQIAMAIVMANRLTGENAPVATCMRQTSRARHVAYAALCEAFPEARKLSLARLTGHATPAAAKPSLNSAMKAAWWRDDWVEEVVGALVADQYGERAA